MSTIRCLMCLGMMVPSHPLSYHSPSQAISEPNSFRRCLVSTLDQEIVQGSNNFLVQFPWCQASMSSQQVITTSVQMYRPLVSCPDSAPHLACLISKLEAAAHPTNYVTIQVRKRFYFAEINIYLLLFIIT